MDSNTKYRHEFKYQCSIGQMEILRNRICNIMALDPHVKGGQYTIRSLYFDNYANRCYYENENGTAPREKFRIRIYNANANRIQLECKRKQAGKTLKTACLLTLEQYSGFLNGIPPEIHPSDPDILKKFIYSYVTQYYRPAVIVEYDRTPFVYPHGNVRVTFDMNIRSSNQFEHFLDSQIAARPILPAGQHLIEVKYDELLPAFIQESLQISDLQQATFSKYYLCKKYSLGGIL